jgi:hypothetical protein
MTTTPGRHLAAVQAADVEPIDYAEGVVLDGPRFVNLYRLLDLERSAMEEAQGLTMPAAFEILAAYESDQWRQDKAAERQAYISEHGYQPQWSAESVETFARWLRDQAERDGHEVRSPRMILNLRNAALCVRITRAEIEQGTYPGTHDVRLPADERSWRPVEGLQRKGFRPQIAAVVVRANEIADEEGEPGVISARRMLVAKREVWKTDPQIRAWVEQPGQTIDPRSKHDRAVTLYIAAKAAADALKKGDDGQMWRKFYNHVLELELGS